MTEVLKTIESLSRFQVPNSQKGGGDKERLAVGKAEGERVEKKKKRGGGEGCVFYYNRHAYLGPRLTEIVLTQH